MSSSDSEDETSGDDIVRVVGTALARARDEGAARGDVRQPWSAAVRKEKAEKNWAARDMHRSPYLHRHPAPGHAPWL